MKRWQVYGLMLAAFLIIRTNLFVGTDVGKLLPVELLLIERDNATFRIRSDTVAAGEGDTIIAAINDMKETSPGEVFLDTADYVLIRDGLEDILPELMHHLRPASNVYILQGDADLSELSAYLRIHSTQQTLRDYCSGEVELSILKVEQERMRFE